MSNLELRLKAIARIETDFSTKFGIPRQSGIINELVGRVVFEEEYRNTDAIRGLSEYSHVWLLWGFSENVRDDWSPTVRPPKLGGNKRVGVFATRSPFRPNPIGLSCVELKKVEIDKELGPVLYVAGADLMNGTPIYDIKPYLTYTDSKPNAKGGFTDELHLQKLLVELPDNIKEKIPGDKQRALVEVLEQDPRPAYHNDPERIYGFEYAGYEVKFKVVENVLKVCEVEEVKK